MPTPEGWVTLDDLHRKWMRDPEFAFRHYLNCIRWYWPAKFLHWLGKQIGRLEYWFLNYGDNGEDWED